MTCIIMFDDIICRNLAIMKVVSACTCLPITVDFLINAPP